jgi:hypothetical protein
VVRDDAPSNERWRLAGTERVLATVFEVGPLVATRSTTAAQSQAGAFMFFALPLRKVSSHAAQASGSNWRAWPSPTTLAR